MKRVLIVSDAWDRQTNGVVTTLRRTHEYLVSQGIEVEIIGPERFVNVPMPGYSEIRLALFAGSKLSQLISQFDPDAIHISTEGPLGIAARRYCLNRKLPFTTSFHTRFPDYVRSRMPIPTAWTWAWLRRFHAKSSAVMTATQALQSELDERGFKRLVRWSRGVDHQLFKPRLDAIERARPRLIYLGRVAVEKNVEDFLQLEQRMDVELVVVGDGPARSDLQKRYPQAQWRGLMEGEALAQALADADCLVFPSRTDTFGLVMVEALACGTPVAAYPEQGPKEVVTPKSGSLNADLTQAVAQALTCDRRDAWARGQEFTWQRAGQQFQRTLSLVSYKRHSDVIATSL
ncbi:MAG: glycosyltransferase family 4 protein [Litorivicinus sp.]